MTRPDLTRYRTTNWKSYNDALMRRGVIARPVGPSGLPRHLRITVGRTHDHAKLLTALQAGAGC